MPEPRESPLKAAHPDVADPDVTTPGRRPGRPRLLGGLLLLGFLLSLLLTIAAYFWAPWREARARHRYPVIVLLSLDTLNVRFTGAYQPEVSYTPHLDALAAEGVRFARSYIPVSLTLPSHTTMMSGRSPYDTGVMNNGDRVSPGITTMAEVLGDAGYRTAAFVSLGVLKSEFGLNQGFDLFDDSLEAPNRRWYRTADEVLAAARPWIEEAAGESFFTWIHLSDPHEPYVLKDAPPDIELTLAPENSDPENPTLENLGRWNLTRKETVTACFDLPPGRHTLSWKSIRRPRADDRRRTALELNLDLAGETLGPWLARDSDGADGPLRGMRKLRPDFRVRLHNPRAEAASLCLDFNGRIVDPPRSEVQEAYRGEIAFLDRQVGELRALLQRLGVEDVLWLVVSDHGEGLFDHGFAGHAGTVYEDQLRLYWTVSGPGIPAGAVVDQVPVRQMDVLPTLLDLLGLPAPEEVEGRSRVGCWAGGAPCPPPAPWWSYGVRNDKVVAVAGYRWPLKWLWHRRRGGHEQAFELITDPWEARSLLRRPEEGEPPEGHPEELPDLRRLGERQRTQLGRRFDERDSSPITPEEEEMLRSLGYLGG